jgi:hypothetical protein
MTGLNRHPPLHVGVTTASVHHSLLPDHAQTGAVVVHLETANGKVHALFHAEQVSAIARRTEKGGFRPRLRIS